MGKLDTFSRSSKLNYITKLIAHPRDFGHKVFANGWGISQRFFKIVQFPLGIPPPPLGVNIDRCIADIQNLVKNGPVVSEKSKFQFSNVNDLGPRSRNEFDLKFSHTFITSISFLHLSTFRSQAAIVPEISTVFTFFL